MGGGVAGVVGRISGEVVVDTAGAKGWTYDVDAVEKSGRVGMVGTVGTVETVEIGGMPCVNVEGGEESMSP